MRQRIARRLKEPEQSMRLSLWEGAFFGLLNGLTQTFLAPLALLLNASNAFIGLLTTLPNLVGSLFQLKAEELLRFVGSRRRYLVWVLSTQGLLWIAVGLLTLIPDEAVARSLLLLIAIAAATTSLLANPVWFGFIGDLVPARRRNEYFGLRNAITGAVTFGTTLAGGFLLQVTHSRTGFLLLFLIAAAARFASAACFWQSADLPLPPRSKRFRLSAFLRRVPTSDFGRFVSLATTLRFAAYVAAPFFVVYQLKTLQLDYLRFTILQLAALVTSFLSARYWASIAEEHGNRAVLRTTTLLITIIPFLWLTTRAYPALLLFELFSGLAWAGFNLASSNYMLEATSAESRTKAISYFNLLNNLSIFLGGLVGSALLWLGRFSAHPFLLLFGVSGLFRLAVLFLNRPLRELRVLHIPLKGKVTSLTLIPQQGVVLQQFAPPGNYMMERIHSLRRRDDSFREFEMVGARSVVKRMTREERQLYRDRFIEKAAGKVPRKPRGFKK